VECMAINPLRIERAGISKRNLGRSEDSGFIVQERAILRCEAVGGDGSVGPRTDDGHVPFEDVQELRQLVELGPFEKAPDPRHASIAANGQKWTRIFVAAVELAEFVNPETFAALAEPCLSEEYRSTALDDD